MIPIAALIAAGVALFVVSTLKRKTAGFAGLIYRQLGALGLSLTMLAPLLALLPLAGLQINASAAVGLALGSILANGFVIYWLHRRGQSIIRPV